MTRKKDDGLGVAGVIPLKSKTAGILRKFDTYFCTTKKHTRTHSLVGFEGTEVRQLIHTT